MRGGRTFLFHESETTATDTGLLRFLDIAAC
jgi:hypothetical protein